MTFGFQLQNYRHSGLRKGEAFALRDEEPQKHVRQGNQPPRSGLAKLGIRRDAFYIDRWNNLIIQNVVLGIAL